MPLDASSRSVAAAAAAVAAEETTAGRARALRTLARWHSLLVRATSSGERSSWHWLHVLRAQVGVALRARVRNGGGAWGSGSQRDARGCAS